MSRRPLTAAAGAVIALTAVGALLEMIAPAVAPNTRPHATLTGSLSDAAAILENNLRALATPFLCVALGLPDSRLGRHTGDLLVLAITALSAIAVGIELARWNTVLLPYVPQLPVEWAALTTAVTAWLTARDGTDRRRAVSELAVLTTMLFLVAAGLETWCVPHRAAPARVTLITDGHHARPSSVWTPAGCLATDLCAGPARSLQGRKLPSPHPVRFRSAAAGAYRATSTTRPPQGGIT